VEVLACLLPIWLVSLARLMLVRLMLVGRMLVDRS